MDKAVIYFLILIKMNSIYCQTYSFEFSISQRADTFNSHYKLYFISKKELCIGTPLQCFTFVFNPSLPTFSIYSNKDILDINNSFDANQSLSFRQIEFIKSFKPSRESFNSALHFNDRIIFEDINSKLNVYLAFDPKQMNETFPEIGLQESNYVSPRQSFAEQLFKERSITNYQISITFINSKTGRIYFGRNETLQSKLVNRTLIEIPLVIPFFNPTITAHLKQVFVGDTIIKVYSHLSFDESSGFIQIHKSYQDKILQSMFLNETISEFKVIINEIRNDYSEKNIKYSSYLVNKKNYQNIKRFNELKFFFGFNITLTLSKEDTFIVYSETDMILAITFHDYDSKDPRWIIGEPILKHYVIEHDLENYVFRLYEKDAFFAFDILIMTFVILCGLAVCGVVVLFVRLYYASKTIITIESNKIENIEYLAMGDN